MANLKPTVDLKTLAHRIAFHGQLASTKTLA
jgi:hypothetical protein